MSYIEYASLEDTNGFRGFSSLFWVGPAKYNAIIDPQKDSYFRITSAEIINNNKIIRVKAEFTASVYNRKCEREVLGDGILCTDFWHDMVDRY